jgi:hypothetical protein
MPSSLIIVALVVAWLVVLVPMIVRKRQEIARTADSALAARVVRSAEEAEEVPMRDVEEIDESPATAEPVEAPDERQAPPPLFEPPRRYRPGRGGFDPEAAAVIARAKYAFRQRVVLAMIVGAVVTGVLGGIVFPMLWWPHGMIDITLIGYLAYLRRQVRIEQEIRERRQARMRVAQRSHAHPPPAPIEVEVEEPAPRRTPVSATAAPPPPRATHPGAVVVDLDDEDPAFDELDNPGNLPYRRAAGE